MTTRASLQLALLLSLALLPSPASAVTAASSNLVNQAWHLIHNQDYLGFRVLIKKAYERRITYGEWAGLKTLVNANSEKAGFDLVYFWNARNESAKSNLDKTLEYADGLALSGRFAQAFDEYQKVARFLKKQRQAVQLQRTQVERQRYREIVALYPFVLHSMGRALYGAGRYAEALTVYQWISPNYARFRQVLFEKMWAGFRAGHVEVALGAIASQRSSYFSKYLSPESYLIQTYIYRKLCRIDDLDQVVAEMKKYETILTKNGAGDWAGNDFEGRVLYGLSKIDTSELDSTVITLAEHEKEKKDIAAGLERSFQAQRGKILADLRTAMAYAHLAANPATSVGLKPVKKLTSRDDLSKQDLEIWPADSAEEWADEVGTHQFIGDSLCDAKPTS